MSFSVYTGKNRGATAATAGVYVAALLAMFWLYLPAPGSLYARVTRDFWPLYHSWPQFDMGHRLFFHFHVFPLWNFLSGFGTPLLANLQSAPFHPARLLFFLPFWKVADLWLLARVFISGMLTYGFLRWRGAGWTGATFGGLAWMLTGSITDYINQHYLDVDLLLPLGMWLFGLMAGRRKFMPVVWSALVVLLAFLGGNPTSILYFLLLVSFYYFFTVYRLREDISGGWFRFFAAAGLTGLAVAALLLPFREFLAFSWDYHPEGVGNIALSARHLLTALGPEVYGDEATSGIPLIQRIPYMGVVPISMAVFGLLCMRRMGSGTAFFAGFAVLLGSVIYGVMPYFLFTYAPLLSRTSNFRYAAPELAFCVALLAGLGWDHITNWKEARWRVMLLPALLTLVSGALLCAKALNWRDLPVRREGLLLFLAISWSVALVLLWRQREAARLCPAFALLATLWIFEAGLHVQYLPPLKPDRPGTFTELPKGITQRDLLEGRIYAAPDILYPDLNLTHGVMDIRYLGALYVDRYAWFMRALGNYTPMEMLNEFYSLNYIAIPGDRLESPLMDLAGATTIISDALLPPNIQAPRIFRRGDIRSPSKLHVGVKKMSIGGDCRVALYEHPPSRIVADMPVGFLFFSIGIDPSRWGLPGDGVTFSIYRKDKKGLKRIFARHIDPAHNPADRGWLDFTVSHPGGKLVFETTPGADVRNDWAGWGEIRSSADAFSRYELTRDVPYRLYDNGSSMLGAFVVGDVKVVGGPREAEIMLKRGFNFRKTAVVEGQRAYSLKLGLGPQEEYKIGLERKPSGNVTLTAMLDNPGVVVLNDAYYPGWRAFIDNEEARIFPADLAFRAVKTPAGKHRIEFVYEPVSFRIGLWVSLSTILILCVIVYHSIRPINGYDS